jgi:hypothetical protein
MPGTGGVFLNNFITAAKNERFKSLKFSENFGNAHKNNVWKLFSMIVDVHYIEDDSLELIHTILSKENDIINDNFLNKFPYYASYHISDIKLVQLYFSKNIRIIYEQSDITEIALSYIGKWEIELANIPTTSDTYDRNFKRTEKYLNTFTIAEILDNNTCYVSWKELTKKDPNELIEKLHSFTNIPKENFFIENLVEWRIKTFDGIEKTRTMLNTKYNTGDILC